MPRSALVATATVTVNAAFLQELKEVNLELWKLLAEVRMQCGRWMSSHTLSDTIQKLQDLRDQLALHFALEEAYGYFEDPLEVAPQFAEKAVALRDEHRDIYVDLCDLVEQAERLFYDQEIATLVTWLGPRFVSFDVRLKDHESRENELIMDAYDCDIGVGD